MILALSLGFTVFGQSKIHKLDNQISETYLMEHLNKDRPRLVYTPLIVKNVRRKIESDSIVANVYKAIKHKANTILELPLLKPNMIGRRLLKTSQEMLWRVNMLGCVYLIEKDPKILERLEQELITVCNFKDWNPSHYLDVAEMSMAVALGLDWASDGLSQKTEELIIKALIEKGIKPSWKNNNEIPDWVNRDNNWNQVCNGGMIGASLAIAEVDPELASKTIYRAINGLPHALSEYGPDGSYPEGTCYWRYGTDFTILASSMLESALGYDFGIANYPMFIKSADFRVLATAPSGKYYNYSDCNDNRPEAGDITLAWFAKKTGNRAFYESDRFLQPIEKSGKLSRITGAGLSWLAMFQNNNYAQVPSLWKGDGINPLIICKNEPNINNGYYLGAKGGKASISHGNMDAGSFIFELHKVRWVEDLGKQNYHNLEKLGFQLWESCQDCDRWKLLSKNNFGHSTITVNNQLHRVNGFANLVTFSFGETPEALFNLTDVLGPVVSKANRKFIKDSNTSLIIEDEIVLSETTELITWQLITTANVEIITGGAILKKEGRALKIENISHPDITISVISLFPTVSQLDKQVKDLKRLEIRIPAWTIKGNKNTIKVRLSEYIDD